MRLKKTIKRLLRKAVLLLLIFLTARIPLTASFYSDIEVSEGNTFTASSLDMVYSSPATDFVGDDLVPGGSGVTRSVAVENVGLLPFNYSQEYEYMVGDPDLCAVLQLQVWDQASTLVYNGALAMFSYPSPTTLAAGNSAIYNYEVTLPAGADSSLWNKTCQFNLRARAWQVGMTYGDGFWDTEVLLSTVLSGNWALVIPVNEGWNLQTQSATPNERPLDLPCGAITDGGDPAHPRIAHNWSAVSGTNILYQREVTFPSSSIGYYYATPNYTPFSSFGSDAGIPGLWRTRVRAFSDTNNNGVYDSGVEAASDWSNYCDVTLSHNYQTPSVVLNEILYNPAGSDNAPMPGGEWIELYNNSSADIDVDGWRIQEDGDFITISTSNSDNNSNTSDAGETIVPANGWLVVYRDGDTRFILTNTGDTVELYDTGNNLIDSHTYIGNKPEGNSEARIPDGTGSWVDPYPTPGRANKLEPGLEDAQSSLAPVQENPEITITIEEIVGEPLEEETTALSVEITATPSPITPTEISVLPVEPTATPSVLGEASPTPTEAPPVSGASPTPEDPPDSPPIEEPIPTPTENQPEEPLSSPAPEASPPVSETPPALPTEEVSQ